MAFVQAEHGLRERRACELLEVDRSSNDYEPQPDRNGEPRGTDKGSDSGHLRERKLHPGLNLASLYDFISMPLNLANLKMHWIALSMLHLAARSRQRQSGWHFCSGYRER
ncbi:hypothetical protein [Acidipila sp. EB88]|uniref:hypothetical protein n=1 Tax=Acidipila sp. EB88 TaxID=2305226 RepID=UPI0011CF2082|nr:hypothetical protein [Acidipila sp. EB88]